MKTISLLIAVLFLSACAQNDSKAPTPVKADKLTTELSKQFQDFNFRASEFRTMIAEATSYDNSIGYYAPKEIRDNCTHQTTTAMSTAAGISMVRVSHVGGTNCPIEVESTIVQPNGREDSSGSWTNKYVIKSDLFQKKYGFLNAQETVRFEFFVFSSSSAAENKKNRSYKSSNEASISLAEGGTAKVWGESASLDAPEDFSGHFSNNLEMNGNVLRREHSNNKGQIVNRYLFNDKDITEEEYRQIIRNGMFDSFTFY